MESKLNQLNRTKKKKLKEKRFGVMGRASHPCEQQ